MADISRIAGSGIVMFSAESNNAEAWMEKIYGRARIYFHVPTDHAQLQLFIRAAKAHGFTIVEETGAG